MINSIVLILAIFTLLYGLISIVAQVVNYIKIEGYNKTLDASWWLLSSILFGLFYYLTH